MADERIIQAIVNKCDFLYEDALLSKEKIIEKYLTFFARQFNPDERSISFAFHTGSVCFDIVSLAALMIGCLAYEFSSNDEILAELEIGDMVLYKGERYRWGGIETMSFGPGEPAKKYISILQDAVGKKGKSRDLIPYERFKHLIKPYYGASSVTDGRGIRKDTTNRNDFIAYVLGIPLADVPTALDISVVVVAEKNEFLDICKHLRIRYNGDRVVQLTDVVPVSYYSGNGEQLQIGKNASKAEAVIKITSKMSMARDLVLDKTGNRVIGLLVSNAASQIINSAELNDLLRRKTLKFAYVVAPFDAPSCDYALEQYETAKMFACTKELLSTAHHVISNPNKLTQELNMQINNILTNKIETVRVQGSWSWERYNSIKDKLFAVKQSSWAGEDKENFLLSALSLVKLFNTSFFSMSLLENALALGEINLAVVSPESRLAELMEIAARTTQMRDHCTAIVSDLLEMYSVLKDESPKEKALISYLEENADKRIALVVPKAYYVELFRRVSQGHFPNVSCVTANRFDQHEQYDAVIATGNILGNKFDPIRCFSAPVIILLLYDCEEKLFSHRAKKASVAEKKLNARIKGLKGEEYKQAVEEAEVTDQDIDEQTTREFTDLDEYVETVGGFDIRRLTTNSGGGDYSNTTEVKFVGVFTTGEQILFSKYYSAVVFDQNKGIVKEEDPEKLLPGDVLVFTKRNDYTRNIVDQIFDQLMRSKKLNQDVQDAAEKSFYWKAALREYKDINRLTYRAVANQLRELGSKLMEVSIRQWLIDESHIVGPRNVETMRYIAILTRDPYLLKDPEGYYEACRIVRHYRREILALIAKAISDKLSNKEPAPGSAFEIVYENVEKLSETMELESVFELDDTAIVNNGMVNRPISESEVLM